MPATKRASCALPGGLAARYHVERATANDRWREGVSGSGHLEWKIVPAERPMKRRRERESTVVQRLDLGSSEGGSPQTHRAWIDRRRWISTGGVWAQRGRCGATSRLSAVPCTGTLSAL